MVYRRRVGRGTLPPGAAKQLERSLTSYRKARNAGVAVRVAVLGADDCPVSMAQAGEVYELDSVPELPLDGCERSPCCVCAYAPVVREEPARSGVQRAHGRRLIVDLSLAILAIATAIGFLLAAPYFVSP